MSTNVKNLAQRFSNKSFLFWTIVLIVSMLLLATNFLMASYNASKDNNARGLASELQVLSQQLAKNAGDAARGSPEAFEEFKARRARGEEIIKTLNTGSTTVQKLGGTFGTQGAMTAVADNWSTIAKSSDLILTNEKKINEIAAAGKSFTDASKR
jgi:twitching motility protein PilJ